jgi:hypothetical protein
VITLHLKALSLECVTVRIRGSLGPVFRLLSQLKFGRDPRQYELAELMILVALGRRSAQDVFNFVVGHGWRHDEIEQRTLHAACIVRRRRPDVYSEAKKIARMFRLKF